MKVYDGKGYLLRCHVCGEAATATVNITANCASGTPSVMQPVCEQHNPYAFEIVWKHPNIASKTTAR